MERPTEKKLARSRIANRNIFDRARHRVSACFLFMVNYPGYIPRMPSSASRLNCGLEMTGTPDAFSPQPRALLVQLLSPSCENVSLSLLVSCWRNACKLFALDPGHVPLLCRRLQRLRSQFQPSKQIQSVSTLLSFAPLVASVSYQ